MCLPRLPSGTSRRPVQPVAKLIPIVKKEEEPADWRWSHVHGRQTHYWVFPLDISQSRLGDRQTTSNACTLIALMLARYIYHTGHRSTPAAVLNQTVCLALSEQFVQLVANSILEGNEAHQKAVKDRGRKDDRDLFTVPAGIRAVKGIHEINWKLVFGVRQNLYRFIWMAIESALTAEFSQVFLVVIIIERAILVSYDRQEHVIYVIDGHGHRLKGAIVLSSDAQNLEEFCAILLEKLFPDLAEDTDRFEISCLQVLTDLPPGMRSDDSKPRFAPKKWMKGVIFEDLPSSLADNGTIRVEV